MNEKEPIDFVICWVDGNDQQWLQEKSKYTPETVSDSREIRYRDWDNLQYWFRGVEKFTPWVRKIHFVTWGHLPKWLNINHPKINIVKHDDYIPKEYLPTFSARPIEINLHRIKGLAEQFVFFNDDMFILKPLNPTDFFINGKPRDTAAMDIAIKDDGIHGSAVYNSIQIINKYFDKRKMLKRDFWKWFSLKNGQALLRTLLLLPWKSFTGFYTPHLPNSFLKKTFIDVWKKESEILKLTSKNRFRNKLDVTQYLFKFWQLASGNFVPRRTIGRTFSIGNDISEIKKVIEQQKYAMICLNDSEDIKDFEKTKKIIQSSFNTIFPNVSKFEI